MNHRTSSRCARALVFVLAATLASHRAHAQIGHPPALSPYRDLEYKQEVTLFSGYFHAAKDPAGVAPRSGPMIGARYEVRVGGPAQFMARVARVSSERQVIDPSQPEGERDLGVVSRGLWAADLGLSLNLTGQKTWHNFVPVLNAGAGIVSDFQTKPDSGDFKFGTAFAFVFGAGLRWVPGGRFQARVDLSDYAYQLNYPQSYYLFASDTTSVLKSSQPSRFWKQNVAFTVGGSYLFFR